MRPHSCRRSFRLAITVAGLLLSATLARGQTVHVTDDTNINLAMPTQLNGTAANVFVRNIGSGGERHTFLQFDLSTLPAGVQVAKATLRVWIAAVNDPGPINVHAVLNPWDEETLAASNAPPLGTLINTLNVTAGDQGKFVLVDVTSLVQAWSNGTLANSGLALVPQASDPVRVTLDSKETTTTSHAPELEVAMLPTSSGDITGVTTGPGLTGGGTAGDVTLSLNTGFTDARYAAALHGHTVSEVAGAATLVANVFTGTQTIDAGNLDLDVSTGAAGNITRNGQPFLHSVGTDNVFLGADAGNLSTSGLANAAVGTRALRDNTSGSNNSALGMNALFHNTTGQGNTASGTNALANNTIGEGNSAHGSFALIGNTTGSVNVAIGSSTLFANTTGSRNVASGSSAMQSNTGGNDNTAIGSAALNRNTIGNRNTVSGYEALFNNISGSGNTVAGADAMLNATGSNNVAIGNNAGLNATTGSNNIYLGANVVGVAGESNTMYLGGTQTTTIIAGVRGTAVTGGEVVVIDPAGRLGSGGVAPAANSVGSAEVIDDSLTAADLAPNAVTSSELAPDSVSADKIAFAYAGSTVEGGAAIDLACIACVDASEVNFGFAGLGANVFTATQTIDTGNLDLDPSTTATGNVTKNGVRFLHNAGTNNTFLGINAGSLSASGFGGNTAVGAQALMSQTFGGPNTAVGFSALAANTGGTGNTALGHGALASNTTGFENTAAGQRALDSTTDGFMNTAFGSQALRFNVTGAHNTALGRGALSNNVGGFNTAIGSSSVSANTTGARNTAVGQSTLFSNTTGSDNVAIGINAGINATTGSNNIYLGADVQGVAAESNTMYLGKQGTQTTTIIAGIRGATVTGGEVVLIDAAGRMGSGSVAPAANSVGSAEVIDDSLTTADLASGSVGSSELGADAVTADKVAFNYAASGAEGGAAIDVACVACVGAGEVGFTFAGLGANTFTATQTIDTGNLDLDVSTATTGNLTKNGAPFLHNFGTSNTFLGVNAGNFTMSSFGGNTAVGTQALSANTTGQSNTATGSEALGSNTTGSGNTADGLFALRLNTTGSANTAVGYGALGNNSSGVNNTATGVGALQLNTTGLANTAHGISALLVNTTGNENTAHGAHALTDNTTGINNTALGSSALVDNSTGSDNVAFGRGAGLFATTGSNNIYLGANVFGVAGESNVMYLGRVGTQTKTFLAGVRGITTVNADAIPVMIDSAGQLGTVSSSRRFKQDIAGMADASERIFRLRPVTFRYTHAFGDGSKPVQFGLVAEEVAEVFPELVVRGADGTIETVHYERLNVLLLNELQKMKIEMQLQQQRMEALERQLSELRTQHQR